MHWKNKTYCLKVKLNALDKQTIFLKINFFFNLLKMRQHIKMVGYKVTKYNLAFGLIFICL